MRALLVVAVVVVASPSLARPPKVLGWDAIAEASVPDINLKASDAARDRLKKQYTQRVFGKANSTQFSGLVKVSAIEKTGKKWTVTASRGLTEAQEIGRINRKYNPPASVGSFSASGLSGGSSAPAYNRKPSVSWVTVSKPVFSAGDKLTVSGPILDANWTADSISVSIQADKQEPYNPDR